MAKAARSPVSKAMNLPEKTTHNVLILAPQGRDAAIAASLLNEVGMATIVSATLGSFETALSDQVCFAVVTEETLLSADLRGISAWIEKQPSWSDLPFIILTKHGGGPERNPSAARLSEVLGNVTFLERPFHPTTFASVSRTAFKGRQRQYEARGRIDELHESEERLRMALLAGRLGSWELDLATSTLSASETCKAVFGVCPQEPFSHDDFMAIIHTEDKARINQALRRTIETGCDYFIEYRNIWSDGSLHWAEVRARLLRDRTGRMRLVGVSSDITSRKIIEENLLLHNEILEAHVAERTIELQKAHDAMFEEIKQREKAEEHLRQAQKMEIIGQLTGGVAHDFNNLLMAVLGNLDLLRKRIPEDPKTLRLIEGAQRGAKRGAVLTQRLLAFARRQDLKLEPTDLIGLVNGMTELIERSVGSNIDIRFEHQIRLPLALVDANQVEMALLNLAVNARDAMPSGGTLMIEIDLAKPSSDMNIAAGDYLRLAVIDTGHGMDSDTLARAIDPFFSTKELGKGTGLGLSMIHGLAVQLNGTLRLSSELGRGTRAELWLPATNAVIAQDEIAVEPQITENLRAPKARILLVDDDVLIAMSTVDMLEDLGHEVIESNSGASAVEILRADLSIDLLITDYLMPGMTGLEVANAARLLRPDLPVLLATGYAEFPQGVDTDFPRLAKPYQQEQLAAEIAKVLKTKDLADVN